MTRHRSCILAATALGLGLALAAAGLPGCARTGSDSAVPRAGDVPPVDQPVAAVADDSGAGESAGVTGTAGTGRPLVFVDPGHGGAEAGAVGNSGSQEKDLVLAVANLLAEDLEATGLVDVELARSVDQDVDLIHRPRRANVAAADVLISLHMNWIDDDRAHGVETYYLNTATDEAAQRLEHRENLNTDDSPGDLETILADLRLTGNVAASRALAGRVQGELVGGLQQLYGDDVRDRGIRTALFAVLVRAEMPAVLVELCFLSNAVEEQRARTRAFQQEAAAAIGRGVIGFLRDVGELPPPDPLDDSP